VSGPVLGWKLYRASREYISERHIPRERFAFTKPTISPKEAVQNCAKWKRKARRMAAEMVKAPSKQKLLRGYASPFPHRKSW